MVSLAYACWGNCCVRQPLETSDIFTLLCSLNAQAKSSVWKYNLLICLVARKFQSTDRVMGHLMFTHKKRTYFIGPIPQTCLLSCYCGIENAAKTGLCDCSYSLHNIICITWRNNFVEVWKDFPRDSGTRVLRVGKPSNSLNHMSTSTEARTQTDAHTHTHTWVMWGWEVGKLHVGGAAL